MLGLIIGVFIGSLIAIVIMSLMYMAKDYEPKKREPEQKETECKEPTILWTVGNLCKWDDKIFEIQGFESLESYNQTFALLKSDDGFKATARVEELEAVEE